MNLLQAIYYKYLNHKPGGWYKFTKDYTRFFHDGTGEKLRKREYKVGDYVRSLQQNFTYNIGTLDEYTHTINIPLNHVEKVNFDPYDNSVYDEYLDRYRYVDPVTKTSSIIWE